MWKGDHGEDPFVNGLAGKSKKDAVARDLLLLCATCHFHNLVVSSRSFSVSSRLKRLLIHAALVHSKTAFIM